MTAALPKPTDAEAGSVLDAVRMRGGSLLEAVRLLDGATAEAIATESEQIAMRRAQDAVARRADGIRMDLAAEARIARQERFQGQLATLTESIDRMAQAIERQQENLAATAIAAREPAPSRGSAGPGAGGVGRVEASSPQAGRGSQEAPIQARPTPPTSPEYRTLDVS